LEPLERATIYLSAAQYPTIADVRFVFTGILEHLENVIEIDEFTQSEMAFSIRQKIEEYWAYIDDQTVIPTILDPRYKLSLFEAGARTTEAISVITSHIQGYNHTAVNTEQLENEESNSPLQYFQRLKKQRLNNDETSRRSSVSSVSSLSSTELDRYLAIRVEEKVKPLLWWQIHENEYPVLAKMSRDYLSIQATSVACEQAFSVAGNTITKTRNRLDPETARSILCAKSWIENNVGIL
jgi:hAT family protein/uncharacterized protein DUF4413